MATDRHRFLARYDDDTPPTVKSWALDILRRALPALVVLFGVNAAVGMFIIHVLHGNPGEAVVNRTLQDGRTPTLDALAMTGSTMGNVTVNIVGCLVLMALVFVATRKWWLAALPGLALLGEAVLHMASTGLVDRTRPAGVEQLDLAPPTAAFPSGHTGATLAQLVIIGFLITRLGRLPLTVAYWLVALAYIGTVIWARLYQGMHSPTDVGMGVVNGITCAVIAWLTPRRNPA